MNYHFSPAVDASLFASFLLLATSCSSGGGTGSIVLASGNENSCAAVSGIPYCWGKVGGTTTESIQSTAVRVDGISNVTQMDAAYGNICAVAGGAAYCWGKNSYNKVGTDAPDGSWVTTPTDLFPGQTVQPSLVAPGGYHTCAVITDTIKCWGLNSSGQLGIGDLNTASTTSPVSVLGL